MAEEKINNAKSHSLLTPVSKTKVKRTNNTDYMFLINESIYV